MSLNSLKTRLVEAGFQVEAIDGVSALRVKKPRKPHRIGESWEDSQGVKKKKSTQGTSTWSKQKRRWVRPDPVQERIKERKRKTTLGG